jgi:hypothetical protein
VPFSKRKTRRSPLQRLNDQRRSLVLAGLAAGAAFSAVVLRRKRRGEGELPEPIVQFEENVPVVAPEPVPVAAAESGPPPAVEVPPAAPEPEAEDAPQPINAAPAGEAGPAAGSAADEPSPVEPATGELSAEEASILSVLAQSGRIDDDRTAIAVATSLERDTGDVADVLRKLGAEGVVSGDLYTASGDKIWAVTERGVRRLGAQH